MLAPKIAAAITLAFGAYVASLPRTTTCRLKVGMNASQVLLILCEGSCATYPDGPCNTLVVTDDSGNSFATCICSATLVDTTCDQAWSITHGFALCNPACTESGHDCTAFEPESQGVGPWGPFDACSGC